MRSSCCCIDFDFEFISVAGFDSVLLNFQRCWQHPRTYCPSFYSYSANSSLNRTQFQTSRKAMPSVETMMIILGKIFILNETRLLRWARASRHFARQTAVACGTDGYWELWCDHWGRFRDFCGFPGCLCLNCSCWSLEWTKYGRDLVCCPCLCRRKISATIKWKLYRSACVAVALDDAEDRPTDWLILQNSKLKVRIWRPFIGRKDQILPAIILLHFTRLSE